MPTTFAHLRQRIFEVPLAIAPGKLEIILRGIGGRIGLEGTAPLAAGDWQAGRSGDEPQIENGIAVIGVQGVLMKRTSGLAAASGCSSYEGIATQYVQCLADKSVRAVVFDIDSPGGETSGLFELHDLLMSRRGEKLTYAAVNDQALSAAYCIASAADRIFITQTGAAGSIGVFCLHVDQSKADKAAGMSYRYIFSGARKIDGHAHAPLSKPAERALQREVDRQYDLFVQAVARGRGLSAGAVARQQAAVYFAQSAISAGLADEVGTLEDACAAAAEMSGVRLKASIPTTKKRGTKMKVTRYSGRSHRADDTDDDQDYDETDRDRNNETEDEPEKADCTCDCPNCERGDCDLCPGCDSPGCTGPACAGASDSDDEDSDDSTEGRHARGQSLNTAAKLEHKLAAMARARAAKTGATYVRAYAAVVAENPRLFQRLQMLHLSRT